MSFELRVVRSVEEIGQEAWDRLGRGQPFTSYHWYRFGEAVLAEEPRAYVILYWRGEAVARSTFWLKRQEPLPVRSRMVRWLLQAALRRWPLLVCRSPLVGASGLILPDSLLRDSALATIIQAAQELARQNRASFLIFDYLEQHQAGWPGWPNGFASATIPDPGTRLVVAWPDFESYLRCLPKSARKDYRRHRNRAADLGVVVTPHQAVTALNEAVVLIRNVEQRHGSVPNPWARRMLEHAGMVDATWLAAEVGDRLVGCGLLLGEDSTRFLTLLGLDYDVKYVYFQLVYAAIRYAIEGGVQVLRGGSGAYQMKQRLGFCLEANNYITVTADSWLLRRIGCWLAAGLGCGTCSESGACPGFVDSQ